jgi:hypothetical protein
MEETPKGWQTGLGRHAARSGFGQQGRIVASLKDDWNRVFPFSM